MLIIKEKKIDEFINKIKEDFDFFCVNEEKLPFKKYFFPPVEETFSLDKKGKIQTNKISNKFVLFGLNLPQLEALTQLDEIMEKPNKDFFYWQRRDLAVVIGLIKENFDTPPGADLVFQEISNDQYKVWENTSKGKNFIKKYQEFFSAQGESASGGEKTAPQIPSGESLNEWSQSMRQLLLDPELLANAVEWSREHKIWDELAEKCLGCGICTYVCPLCHCFSIEDSVDLESRCSRCRKWDACTLPGFSKIGGGHSFRPTIKERYYNWFYHKFVRAYKEYGKSQCVGCSACKNNCPAGIDIQEILKRILEDYKKENE